MKNSNTNLSVVYACFLFTILCFFSSCNPSTDFIENQKTIYAKAIAANDPNTAINAAYQILSLDVNEKYYQDSIASIYFDIGNYKGAIIVAEGILKDHTSKELFNILAYSKMRSGNFLNASLNLQDLMAIDSSNNLQYLYDMGTCFFNIKNYSTSTEIMNRILADKKSKLITKTFVFENKPIEVSYYIAALNIIGFTYIFDKNYEEAEKVYQHLFKLNQEFPLAINNYKYLQQLKEKVE